MTAPSNKLNDYTREELEAALARYLDAKVTESARCKWCGVSFTKNRRWQSFCTKNHQTLWHSKSKDLEIERLQALVASQDRLINELRVELSRKEKNDPTNGYRQS